MTKRMNIATAVSKLVTSKIIRLTRLEDPNCFVCFDDNFRECENSSLRNLKAKP